MRERDKYEDLGVGGRIIIILRQVNGSRLNHAATSPTAVYGTLSKRSYRREAGGDKQMRDFANEIRKGTRTAEGLLGGLRGVQTHTPY